MPTLNIEGRRVKVDDSFMQLSPEDQAKTVDEIAVSLGIHPQQQQAQPEAPKVTGKHLSFEEGEALLNADSTAGKAAAMGEGFLDQIPVAGPYLTSAAKHGGAALGSLLTGKSYDDALKQAELDYNAVQTVNPKSAMTGRVVGAVAPMVAVGGTALGGRLLGNTGSLLAKSAFGAGSGAVIGGADTAARGGDAMDVAKSSALGFGLGGLLPVAMAGVGKGYNVVKDALSAREAAASAGTAPAVLDMLKNTMEADGTLGPVGQANMAAAGKDAMLADAGPNAKAILDTAIQRGGPGAVSARQAIEKRVANASADLTAALDDTLGKVGESQSREMIVYGDKTNPLSLLYKRAYATPIDYSQPAAMEIEQMVKDRVPASAIRAANELMRVEGHTSKQIMAHIADDGSVVFEKLPDVRQLDYITRGLKQVADMADGQGKLGGTTPVGRAYGNLATEIRSRLKDLVPEYKTALNVAGTEIGKVKASEFGEKLLSDAVSRNEVRDFLADLPNAERAKAIQSVRQTLDDKLANVKRALTDGNVDARETVAGLKTLSSRANREKLAFLVGKAKADQVLSEVDRITKTFELRAAVSENSKTYARQAVDAKVKQMTDPGPIGLIKQGKPYAAGKRVLQEFTGMTPARIQAREEAIYSQMSDFLTRSPDRSKSAFDALQQYGVQQGLNRQAAQKLAARALSGASRLTYPTTRLLSGMTGQSQGTQQ